MLPFLLFCYLAQPPAFLITCLPFSSISSRSNLVATTVAATIMVTVTHGTQLLQGGAHTLVYLLLLCCGAHFALCVLLLLLPLL